MDTVRAKTYLSNLTSGENTRFYLKPETVSSVSYDQLCQKVANATGKPLSTVRYTMDVVNQKIIDLLAKNYRIHTGCFVASLGIGGSVDSITAQPNKVDNPVHAVLTPEGDIVTALKALEVVNVSEVVAAIINEVQETGCAEFNKLTTANTNVVINGACIKIDTTKTDEGVWLANRTTGVVVKTATIVETDSARCVVKFATLPEDGSYDLVIATRNCTEGMDVVTKSRIVTVEAAA